MYCYNSGGDADGGTIVCVCVCSQLTQLTQASARRAVNGDKLRHGYVRERCVVNTTQASHVGYSRLTLQKGRVMFHRFLERLRGPYKRVGARFSSVQLSVEWFSTAHYDG